MPQKTDEALVAEASAAVQAVVEKDHKAVGFRIGDFIRTGGVKMPEITVDVYTDVDAGYKRQQAQAAYEDLQNAAAGHAFGPPEELQEQIDAAKATVDELDKQIQDTRLVFHLRGLAPKLALSIVKKGAAKDKKREIGEGDFPWSDVEMFRRSVMYIQQGDDGEIDPWEFETGSVHEDANWEYAEGVLRGLYFPEVQKLMAMVNIIAMGVTLADHRSDAGFPGGSTEPAGKLGVDVPAESGDGPASITDLNDDGAGVSAEEGSA